MTGTVPPPLEAELAAALSARAAAVGATATPAARAAVDRRRAHRRDRRRRRRGLGAAAGVMAVVALATSALAGGRGGDVVTGVGDGVPPGLPEVVLDRSSGLVPDDRGPQPIEEPTPFATPWLEGMRVLRPAGAVLPVIFEPRSSTYGARAAPEGIYLSEPVGADGRWTGLGWGWGPIEEALAGGSTRPVLAFGVDDLGTLSDTAQVEVPTGFVEHEVVADPADPAGVPGYGLRYEGAGRVAELRVWAEGDLRREVALLRVLAEAGTVATVEVDGRPGVAAEHPDGSWSIGWSPADGVTAALVVRGDGLDVASVRELAGDLRG